MEITFVLFSVLQSVAISLGVGCSTLAVLNFFSAIADGTIDETERRMMGVVYVVLRIAMVLILLTTFGIAAITYSEASLYLFSPYLLGLWTLIAVLYVNALLMTLHVVPSTIGPAIQASTWYTLGVLAALAPLNLVNFSYWQFLLGYFCAFLLATFLINGTMWYLRHHKPTK